MGYYDQWLGSSRCIAASAGVSDDVIAFYEAAFKAAMEDPDYLEAASSFMTDYKDAAAFRRLMRFIILTYSAALLVFFLFPTCQYLRPALLFRGNPLVRLVASIYANDTNTNVCPSIHVIGSLAVWFAARDTGKLPAILRKGAIPIMTVLISISTVFLKQHSVLDIIAALLVCAAAYPVVYRSVPARHPVSLRIRALSSRKYPQL